MKNILSSIAIFLVLFANAQTGTVSSYEKISSTQGNLPITLVNNSRFGSTVAQIGDLNNDGVNDLAVCSFSGGYGMVNILFMNSNGTVNSATTIGPNIGGFNGTFPYSMTYFGCAIAGLGDLNNDGVVDILVGNSQGGGAMRGEAYILFMNANGTVNHNVWIAEGQGFNGNLQANDYMGTGVANLGDVNSDGVTDIALGLPGDAGIGGIWILFLDTSGGIIGQQKINSTQGNFTGVLAPGGVYFGCAVAAIGDINSDGVPDMMASAASDTTNTPSGIDYSSVWIMFLNASGQVINQQKISQGNGGFTDAIEQYSHFGYSLSSVGDIDGNGIPDILVGAENQSEGGISKGAVWLMFMNANGTVSGEVKISGQSGGFTATIANQDYLGNSVCGIGDLNNDNRNDVVVGALGDDDGGSLRGAVYILHLNGPQVLGIPTTETFGSFNTFPNPSCGSDISIEMDQLQSGIIQYTLVDALGRIAISGNASSQKFIIATEKLSSGIYFLNIEQDNYILHKKIIISLRN